MARGIEATLGRPLASPTATGNPSWPYAPCSRGIKLRDDDPIIRLAPCTVSAKNEPAQLLRRSDRGQRFAIQNVKAKVVAHHETSIEKVLDRAAD